MRPLIHWLVSLGAAIASWLFVLAGAMLTYEVVARYFFTRPTSWAAELSQMCLIWGSLLAMASLLARRQHIQVDAVVQLLPAGAVRWVDRLVLLIIGLFAVTVTWYGFDIFHESFVRGRTTGSMLNLPAWIVELAVPVGFALLGVQCVDDLLRSFSDGETPSDTHVEDPAS